MQLEGMAAPAACQLPQPTQALPQHIRPTGKATAGLPALVLPSELLWCTTEWRLVASPGSVQTVYELTIRQAADSSLFRLTPAQLCMQDPNCTKQLYSL